MMETVTFEQLEFMLDQLEEYDSQSDPGKFGTVTGYFANGIRFAQMIEQDGQPERYMIDYDQHRRQLTLQQAGYHGTAEKIALEETDE